MFYDHENVRVGRSQSGTSPYSYYYAQCVLAIDMSLGKLDQ